VTKLYRDELANDAPDGFSCLTEDDTCNVALSCDAYFLQNGQWIGLAIKNLHRVMKTQIKGYDRAMEKWEAKFVQPLD
jgi:hypothetical protein